MLDDLPLDELFFYGDFLELWDDDPIFLFELKELRLLFFGLGLCCFLRFKTNGGKIIE